MEIDPIEIRVCNYFEHKRQVIELTEHDLQNLPALLPELKPISITGYRLGRLNFTYIGNIETRQQQWQKFVSGIYFNLYFNRDETFTLYINDDIKLKHIQYIHQLQNVYYDLTGDVLKRPKPGEIIKEKAPVIFNTGGLSKSRSGPVRVNTVIKGNRVVLLHRCPFMAIIAIRLFHTLKVSAYINVSINR